MEAVVTAVVEKMAIGWYGGGGWHDGGVTMDSDGGNGGSRGNGDGGGADGRNRAGTVAGVLGVLWWWPL